MCKGVGRGERGRKKVGQGRRRRRRKSRREGGKMYYRRRRRKRRRLEAVVRKRIGICVRINIRE